MHLGLYDDETAERCHWHVPQAHALEAWGDARAYDGTVTIHAAADRAALPGVQVRPRDAGRVLRAAGRAGPRRRARLLAHRRHAGGRLRARLARARCTTAWCAGWRASPAAAALGRAGARAGRSAPPAPRRAAGPRDRLPSRSHRRRRPLREQRLAAGAAEAAHQADLGQRGPHEPGHRAAPRHLHRAHRAGHARPTSSSCATAAARVQAPALDHARPSRRHRDRAPRLRPHARRAAWAAASASTPTRCAPATRPGSARGLEVAKTGEPLHAGLHPGPLEHGGPRRASARPPLERVRREHPDYRAQGGARAAARADHVPRLQVRGPRLGHVHRPQLLRRLQRLRGGLPGREQHPGGRQASRSPTAARCTGCASTATTRAGAERPRDVLPADALHALRERALRGRCARWPPPCTATRG